MADWILVPCLVQLRDEFNEIAPRRDKASDGSIGDTAHAAGGNSDHLPDEDFDALRGKDADRTNEVHAIDVDKDLTGSGTTMEEVVQFLLARCRAGTEKRLRYIIFNGRIWSASSGWVRKTYTGPNKHTQHAHFSASYDTKHEADKGSWHLEDLVMPTADEIAAAVVKKIRTTYPVLSDSDIAAIARGVWNHEEIDPRITVANGYTQAQVDAEKANPTYRLGGAARLADLRDEQRAAGHAEGSETRENDALDRLIRLEQKFDQLAAQLAPGSGQEGQE